MTTVRRPIFHVLYTNAPGEDRQSGFRYLQVGYAGAVDELRPIEEWLRQLEPAPGSLKGWAVSSFRVGGVRCPALAVVDPSFSLDESNRAGGRLAHALAVPLDDDKPIGHFSRALYERARSFFEDGPGSPSPSLKTYLEGCRLIDVVDIPEIQEDEIERALHLTPIIQALVDAGSSDLKELLLPGVSEEEELPEKILAASAVLPPVLRLGLRWRVGLQGGGEGVTVRPAGAGGATVMERRDMGQAYADDLWRRLQHGGAAELVQTVNQNWEIKEWKPLPAAAPSPPDLPGVSPWPEQEPVPEPWTEESEPMTRKKASGGNQVGGAVQRPVAKSAEAYDREYQSLMEELKGYIDLRLQNLGAPPPMTKRRSDPAGASDAEQGAVAETARRDRLRWMLEWRPEAYCILVLLLLGGMYSKLQPPQAGKVDHDDPSTALTVGSADPSAHIDVETTTVPDPLGSSQDVESDPVAGWASFLDEQPAVAAEWFRAVAEARRLESWQVRDSQKQAFRNFAAKLDQGQALTAAEEAHAATGLFEYVHARWARSNGVGPARENVVTLDPGEATANLGRLAASLHLSLPAGATPADPAVRTVVVLRWIQTYAGP